MILVGAGPDRSRLEKLAVRLLLSGSYQFLPPVPAPEVLELMRQHHIYVLPSSGYEGWGAVINEAMCAGCAVVASMAAGVARTMIEHGQNGLLFQPGNWKDLTKNLYLLAQDKTMRNQLAREGQKTISEYWSPSIAANRFLATTEAIL